MARSGPASGSPAPPILWVELGDIPFERESTDLLFQPISQRYERPSIALTTNLLGGAPVVVAAVLGQFRDGKSTRRQVAAVSGYDG